MRLRGVRRARCGRWQVVCEVGGSWLIYFAVQPPSTASVWPVTKEALSEHNQRKASAISSGWPVRPTGCMAAIWRKIYGANGAAALLKIQPTTLVSKMKRLGVTAAK